MATIVLRPSADISVEHEKSRGNSGYSLINEATADDNTYIQCVLESNRTTSATSTFKVNGSVSNKIYLQSLSLTVRAERYKASTVTSESSSITGGIAIGSNNYTTGSAQNLSNDWTNKTFNVSPSGLNTKYDSFDSADIRISLYTSGTYRANKTRTVADRISQAYVTATYLNVWNCEAFGVPGTGIASATVSRDEVIDTLENCTWTATIEDRYKFLGWYSDEACTHLVSENLTYTASPTDNMTLYAKGEYVWEVDVYPDENCTVSANPTSGITGTNVIVTASFTERYIFEGWYSNPSRTTLVSSNNPYTFILDKDVVLYAKVKLNETMYVKLNGSWVECREVYKKVDGQWILQNQLRDLFDENKNYKIIEV